MLPGCSLSEVGALRPKGSIHKLSESPDYQLTLTTHLQTKEVLTFSKSSTSKQPNRTLTTNHVSLRCRPCHAQRPRRCQTNSPPNRRRRKPHQQPHRQGLPRNWRVLRNRHRDLASHVRHRSPRNRHRAQHGQRESRRRRDRTQHSLQRQNHLGAHGQRVPGEREESCR